MQWRGASRQACSEPPTRHSITRTGHNRRDALPSPQESRPTPPAAMTGRASNLCRRRLLRQVRAGPRRFRRSAEPMRRVLSRYLGSDGSVRICGRAAELQSRWRSPGGAMRFAAALSGPRACRTAVASAAPILRPSAAAARRVERRARCARRRRQPATYSPLDSPRKLSMSAARWEGLAR
jgi:hypothetical protein